MKAETRKALTGASILTAGFVVGSVLFDWFLNGSFDFALGSLMVAIAIFVGSWLAIRAQQPKDDDGPAS